MESRIQSLSMECDRWYLIINYASITLTSAFISGLEEKNLEILSATMSQSSSKAKWPMSRIYVSISLRSLLYGCVPDSGKI